jgi:REP element-mobilizing transposase RayT
MEKPDPTTDKHRKKIQHFNEPGHAHFLTFSCYRRMPLLSKDRSRNWLIEAIIAARQKHGFELWAWVAMPEHVHLLIWPRKSEYRIPTILADIKRPVGQQAIAWLELNHPEFLEKLTVRNRNRIYHRFWQAGPGQDRNVYDRWCQISNATLRHAAHRENRHLSPAVKLGKIGKTGRLASLGLSSVANGVKTGSF